MPCRYVAASNYMGDLVQAGGLADLSPFLVDAAALDYEDILPYFRRGRHVGRLFKR
jgi:hypothetical protein